jgi:hypothetical protein
MLYPEEESNGANNYNASELPLSTLPDIIRVKVINSETGNPIPNIAVYIHIYANPENDYHFILPFTDKDGHIEVRRHWLKERINYGPKGSTLLFGLSHLEDYQYQFRFEVLSGEQVKQAVAKQYLYKKTFGIKQEYIDSLSQVDNFKYTPMSKMVEPNGDKVIEVELMIREAHLA